jgi:hypothetical protein
MLVILGSLGTLAFAQSSYVPPIVGTTTTTIFSNNNNEFGTSRTVAADKAGNVYFLDNLTPPGNFYEIPHATPAATITTPVLLITGLCQYCSLSVFVDPNGNLWLNDGASLDEIPALNGIPNTSLIPSGGDTLSTIENVSCTVPATAPCSFSGLAGNLTLGYGQFSTGYVDGSGNAYLVDGYDIASQGAYNRLVEINLSNPGTGTLLADKLTSNDTAQLTLGGDGKLYYLDNYDGQNDSGGNPTNGTGSGLVSLVSGWTSTTPGTLTTVGNTATIASAEISKAVSISTDVYGNLYIAGQFQVSEVPLEGTTLNFADEFGITSNLANMIFSGGQVDANGNYYYSSWNTINEVQVGYNFGTVDVGSDVTTGSTVPAPTLNLYFNADETVTGSDFPTGSPTTNTNAALLQSFPEDIATTLSAGSSFTPGNPSSNPSSVVVDFQPIHPGLLKGSYTPVNSIGGIEANINLQGVGAGPQPMFLPGVASSLFTSAATSTTVATPINLSGPSGIAVDTFGDIFVADPGNGRVVADCLATTATAASYSLCASSGYAGKTVGLGTSFTTPAGIALDGANSLYVADSAANTVTVIQGNTGASSTLVAAASTFGGAALNGPTSIALDGYANVYIADTGNNRIVMAHQFGAAATDNVVYVSSTTTFGGAALSGPTGLAVDAAGDLFIADTGNNRIVEYSALGAASVVTITGVTLSAPTGVAVLPSGSLVVTDATNGVSLITGGNGSALSFDNTSTGTPISIGKLVGVALDLSGNIYSADTVNNDAVELNVSSPAMAPSFPATAQATTSTSNDTTEVFNSGNATLSFSAAPALDSGDTNFGILNTGTCTTGATVTASESCTVVTDFTPQATGALTGTVTLTDNQLGYTLITSSLNETAAFLTSGMQTVGLSGTGSGGKTQTITFGSIAAQMVGTPLTLSATATSGLAVTFTSTTTSVCTVAGTTATFVAAGTCTIDADQAGNSTYAAAPTVSQSFTVNGPSLTAQTITFAKPGTQTVGTPLTLTATATSGLAVTFTSTTTSVCTVAVTTATFVAAGTCTIDADQAGNSTYAAAPTVSQSFTVNATALTAQTIAFAQPAAQWVGTPLTLTATATSGLAVTFTSTTTSVCTVASTTATFVAAGTCTIDADQAGNSSYAAAPTVSQSFTVNAASAAPYTVTASTTALTVTAGQSSSPITITLAPENGFTGAVTFACSGLPTGATCNFTPASITLPGVTSTQLTISTTTASAAVRPNSSPLFPGTTLAVALCCFVGFRRRRALQMFALLTVGVIGLGLFTGCGGSSAKSSVSTVTVTATSTTTGLAMSANITLTVKN